jgi:hypothetical protein
VSTTSIITFAFTANTQSSGTFIPRAKYGFNVSISGTFSATVGLYRQLPGDSSSTWRLVNSWIAPVETAVIDYENGVVYQLQTSAYVSGTANGRLGQSL